MMTITNIARIKVRLTTDGVFLASLAITAFVLSMTIAPYHVNGDQVHYTKAYDAMRGLGLADAFRAYRSKIFSFEPVHFFVSWIFVNLGFDKTIAMSGLNGLAAALLGRFFLIRTHNYALVFVLVFSNQYLYAIFFTLEKLKIAIIFLLLFLNFRLRIFGVLAAFAHLQIALLFAIYFSASTLASVRLNRFGNFLKRRTIIPTMILLIILAAGGFMFFNYSVVKLTYYMSRDGVGGISAAAPAIAVGIVTLLATNHNRKLGMWYFTILAVLIVVIGGDRINMYAFFGFFYFTIHRGKKVFEGAVFTGAFALCSLYLGYKSYNYLFTVINFGG
jgi:hypothetical protein